VKRALLLWAVIVAAIVALLVRSDAWRPKPPVIAGGVRSFVLDDEDVGAACAEATVHIEGISPELLQRRPADFFDRVRAAVGVGAANTIHSLYIARHLSVGKNEVFFGSRQLCDRKDLPDGCRTQCNAAGYSP